MSGGLDSTLLAATAVRAARAMGRDLDAKAFTCFYESLIPDDEKPYAQMAADHVGIPIEFIAVDRFQDPVRWLKPPRFGPEPAEISSLDSSFIEDRLVAAHSRVLFYGEGPDNLLKFEWGPYIGFLCQRREYWRIPLEITTSLVHRRRIPFLNRLWRAAFVPSQPEDSELASSGCMLPCIVPRLAETLGLSARIHDRYHSPATSHPFHPAAYESMHLAGWRQLFEFFDPGFSGIPAECRHPYLDVRLANFLLSVPTIPWADGKYLLRSAGRGLLPDPVLSRRKTTPSRSTRHRLAGYERLNAGVAKDSPLGRYIAHYPEDHAGSPEFVAACIRIRSLDLWFEHQHSERKIHVHI